MDGYSLRYGHLPGMVTVLRDKDYERNGNSHGMATILKMVTILGMVNVTF